MSNRYAFIIAPVAAAAAAYALTPLVVRLAFAIGAVDQPGDRKIHRSAMPRLGGLAVILAVALTLGLAPLLGGESWAVPAQYFVGLVVGLIPIFCVSLADDIRPVPARIKFCCHALGAALAIGFGISLPQQIHVLGQEVYIGLLAIPISALWLIGVTNAFNIIDGLDGLASGLAFISALAVGAVFVTTGQLSSALLPLVLAGAIGGFLPYNMYPARVFLGDTGATAIGFALAVVALKGGQTIPAGFAAATPVLILGLPIADTLIAIARRAVRRVELRTGSLFQPDANHVHHRLLALGIDHRTAVLVLYGFGWLMAVVAYVSLFLTSRESALLLLALLIAASVGLKRLGYDEFALLRRGMILRFYEAPVLRGTMFAVFVDIVFVAVSVYLAVVLRSDDWLLTTHRELVMTAALALVPLSVVVFWLSRLYEGSWRIANINDFARAARASWTVVFLALVIYSWQLETIPAAFLIVYGLTNTFLMVCSRASYRMLVHAQRVAGRAGATVLIYGPGPADFIEARDLIDRVGSFGLRPVGFITEHGRGRGKLLAGLKIGGALAELSEVVKGFGAEAVIMACRHPSYEAAQEFADRCHQAGVTPYRLNTDLLPMGGLEATETTPLGRQPTPLYALGGSHPHPRRRRTDFMSSPADRRDGDSAAGSPAPNLTMSSLTSGRS